MFVLTLAPNRDVSTGLSLALTFPTSRTVVSLSVRMSPDAVPNLTISVYIENNDFQASILQVRVQEGVPLRALIYCLMSFSIASMDSAVRHVSRMGDDIEESTYTSGVRWGDPELWRGEVSRQYFDRLAIQRTPSPDNLGESSER